MMRRSSPVAIGLAALALCVSISAQNRTAVDVYKGSNKIYGEPDHDFVDTL